MLYRLGLKRLYRKLKYVFDFKTIFDWEYESCIKCGHCFRLCWNIENEIWKKVIGVNDETGGSYCLDCFIELAERKNIIITNNDFDTFKIFNPYFRT